MKQLKKLMGAGLLMMALGMPQAYLSAKSLKVLGWGSPVGPFKVLRGQLGGSPAFSRC